ncbi:hypothetical protein M8C21_031493 [Ambrosia artemisiifolia]|uniref:Uncharacterized protein n=1 Tax=Ambrosia artemisiifolia TaxID=4212 RepID=A0AAD5GE93_AMBAR|nr:hypothetical protein M8C21_031493 [Ambrosia artemisiifolia]
MINMNPLYRVGPEQEQKLPRMEMDYQRIVKRKSFHCSIGLR